MEELSGHLFKITCGFFPFLKGKDYVFFTHRHGNLRNSNNSFAGVGALYVCSEILCFGKCTIFVT